MTYRDGFKDRCKACNKLLVYDIVEDRFEFCNCIEKKQEAKVVPPANDQGSICDIFEREIEAVILKYSDQGLTIGSAVGALQNRIFNLNLNLHLVDIIELVKRNIK